MIYLFYLFIFIEQLSITLTLCKVTDFSNVTEQSGWYKDCTGIGLSPGLPSTRIACSWLVSRFEQLYISKVCVPLSMYRFLKVIIYEYTFF